MDYEENFVSDGLQRRLTIYPRKPSSIVFGVVFVLEDFARIQQQVRELANRDWSLGLLLI